MKYLKLFLPLLAVFMVLNLTACAETPVPVISVGNIHTAATTSELYELFAADAERSYSDQADTQKPTVSGSKLQGGIATQVEGYEEDDMVKTDGTNLYILDAGDLKIVSAQGAESQLLSVTGVWNEDAEDRYETARGLYVSGNILAVLVDAEVFGESSSVATYADQCHIRLYDISDPTQPKLTGDLAQDGYLLASRLHDGKVYLISADYKLSPKQKEEASFMPIIWNEDDSEPLPLDHIFICPTESARSYTVVSVIDLATAARVDACAFTGESSSVFMNNAGLYLARTRTSYEAGPGANVSIESRNTEIKRVRLIDNVLTLTDLVEVPGKVLNPYSMDIQSSVLRLATTSDRLQVESYKDNTGKMVYNTKIDPESMRSNVYIFSEDLRQLGGLTDITRGEEIYSARLIDNAAYLITYSPETPFHVVDLSDYKNPAVVRNPGVQIVSGYLHPLEKNRLIGIGKDLDFQISAEVLDVSTLSELKTMSTLATSYGSSDATQDPRALLVWQEKQLVGFPADKAYVLLSYVDGELTERGSVPYAFNSTNTRGIAVGELLYICDPQAVSVVDPTDASVMTSLTFGAG